MEKDLLCVTYLVYESGPDAIINGFRVNDIRKEIGAQAAKSVPTEVFSNTDCICPIPKTGIIYAEGLSSSLGIPMYDGVIKRSTDRTLYMEGSNNRRDYLNSIMQVDHLVKGKRVLLVDEAVFTGVTLEIVCAKLHEAGAKNVYAMIPTPLFRCPDKCYSHSDVCKRMERLNTKDLLSKTNLDWIGFQDRQSFQNLLHKKSISVCECL